MIEVAATIIENDTGCILIARRGAGKSQAGMWEFPGGKLEAGEFLEQCLKRELVEEMQIEIEPYAYYGQHDHHYGDTHIRLIAYKARFVSGEIHLMDHVEYRWVKRDELVEFTFAPADIRFVEMLQRELTENTVKRSLKAAYNAASSIRDTSDIEPWKVEEREQVRSAFRKAGVSSLLEIGAGPGRDSYYFQQNGFEVTAIDYAEEMVELCQRKGITARVMDFYHLDFVDQSFDGIYAMNCLLHVPKVELSRVLKEINRVLAPGGIFYLGLYGGISTDEVWEQDTYEPKRYFSMYPDEEIQRVVGMHFKVEEFHIRSMGEGRPHFQGMLLSKIRN